MVVFNGKIYVSDINTSGGTLRIYSWNPIDGWTEEDSASSQAQGVALMQEYSDKLYVTAEGNKVYSLSQSNVLSTSGTSTLDLGLPDGWVITSLIASNDRLWIGVLNSDGIGGFVYEWNGETENTPNRRYEVDTGVLSMVTWENIPYAIDTQGRLLKYNGASFSEIARLPITTNPLSNNTQELNTRWIHPNGMQVGDNSILIAISSDLEGTTDSDKRIPSGIWEYTPKTGLYHKYSPSVTKNTDSTISDHGMHLDANNSVRPGALYYYKESGSDTSNGTVLYSSNYTIGDTTSLSGIFTDETLNEKQKYAYFVTTKLVSAGVTDLWQKLYATYSQFTTAGDKIVVKYKTREDTPLKFEFTWTSENEFNTTADLSTYDVGDEVFVLNGNGAGKTAHIKTIESSASTYSVLLDESFTGASGDAQGMVEKWIKSGEVTIDSSTSDQFTGFTVAEESQSPWIQFKVCIQTTGESEIYKLRIINDTTVKQ